MKRQSSQHKPNAAGWLVTFALAVALLSGLPAVGQQPSLASISPDLAAQLSSASPQTRFDVIVQYAMPPGLADVAAATSLGGRLKADLDLIKSKAYNLPAAAIPAWAPNPRVTYITADRTVKMSLDYVSKAVNADIAWSYGYDGTGVGIAIIDSGTWSHPDLQKISAPQLRVVYNESFVPADPTTSDLYGHGTHVAGIAAGNGKTSVPGYRGDFKGIAS